MGKEQLSLEAVVDFDVTGYHDFCLFSIPYFQVDPPTFVTVSMSRPTRLCLH